MCHHFVPRGGCRRRSRLGKSAIAAPTLDGITVVRAQGSTLAPVHFEIRRISRSHLAVMHVLGVSSFLTCPRDPPTRCRSRSHLTVVRNLRGRFACTSGRRCRARALSRSAVATAGTSLSCTPHGATATCVPSDPMPQPLPPRRRARLRGGPSPRAGLRDLPPRACPPDPPSRTCSQDVVRCGQCDKARR
jgi:hypothetical protein